MIFGFSFPKKYAKRIEAAGRNEEDLKITLFITLNLRC